MDKISESGASVLSGHGIEDVKNRILAAFDAVRQPQAVAFERMLQGAGRKEVLEQTTSELSATGDAAEKQIAHFKRHANRLTLAALDSAHIISETTKGFRQHSYYVGELSKQPLAEDLFAEATREPAKTESKRKRSS